MTRRVVAVTTSRADYSHLYWVLHELRERPSCELRILAAGAPLADEFGATVTEMERDGFEVAERVECLLSSDTDVGMAKTIGLATIGLADTLSRRRPDILLLIADRYELLAPASVALALRIPIAHIEGGEVSEGAIDDAVRNAVTKMSHLHFTPTERARRRVLAMGEESWRVHRVGAPSLDHLAKRELPSRAEIAERLGVDVRPDAAVIAYHPVTLFRDPLREAEAVYEALGRIDRQLLFCFPNSDAGSRALIRRTERFCAQRARASLFVNLNPRDYWGLLRHAGLMLGNSSSGIMETPSLELPTVNVGDRQHGRERARNILDCPATSDAIVEAVARASDAGFRESLAGMRNPYGDGHAAERIADELLAAPLGEELLRKRAPSLSPACGSEA